MTTNQIAYWQLEEAKRANRAKEAETSLHNRRSEYIAERGADAADEKNAISRESIFTQAQTADKDRASREAIDAANRDLKRKVSQNEIGSRSMIANLDRQSREKIEADKRDVDREKINTEVNNLLAKLQHESAENALQFGRDVELQRLGKNADLVIQRSKDDAAFAREVLGTLGDISTSFMRGASGRGVAWN